MMKKFGLIGYPLGHSASPFIHDFFLHQPYDLCPLQPSKLQDFFESHQYDGVNVTIPYKKEVFQYVQHIDLHAQAIGAINTICYQEDGYHGYNTDYLGFYDLLKKAKLDLQGAKVAILGTGGASQAVCYALNQYADCQLFRVSRQKQADCITYEQLYEQADMMDVIVNTTPVGMYPKLLESPLDLRSFRNVKIVIDIIANPLRTKLLQQAEQLQKKTYGGNQMLVRQAAYADQIFTGVLPNEQQIQGCLKALIKKQQNIVLIGMPTSGKSTIAKALGQRMDMPIIDMDEQIEKEQHCSITQLFERHGEAYFRQLEHELVQKLALEKGVIISTGGGIILNPKNMEYLKANGICVFIDRPLKQLFASQDRPLSKTQDEIQKLYEMRYPLYQQYGDIHIQNTTTVQEAIQQIEKGLDL